MKQIITHAGIFHADEIVAIAIIKRVYGNLPIIRNHRPSSEELADPEIFVIDVGKDYNPKMNNFDHHQDEDLPASNFLIWNKFMLEIALISRLNSKQAKIFSEKMIGNFIRYISDVDRGKIIETSSTSSINSIIRSLNNIANGFETAIHVAEIALEGAIQTAILAVKGIILWEGFERLSDKVKIQETTDFIPDWKEMAKEEDICYLVQKNLKEGWQVVSRSTDEFILPESTLQTFRHNSGFMIVFAEKQQAIDYALSL